MMTPRPIAICILAASLCWCARNVTAQNAAPADEHAPAAPPFSGGGAGTFPTRPNSPQAALDRGKALYKTNCAYCHGEDARGGENGGNNLLRSDYLMKDKVGEVLSSFLQTTISAEHKFSFTNGQVADLAAFIHDFRVNSRDPGRMRPPTILVGDAKAGQAYFQAKCAACHSATGDLKGIATRISDPRNLQQTWLMPMLVNTRPGGGPADGPASNVPRVTVTVTQSDGQKVEGRLGRIDDFFLTLTQADGTSRSFRRDGETPKVEVHDPMKPHKDLLPGYSDADIHNLTAYLVTFK